MTDPPEEDGPPVHWAGPGDVPTSVSKGHHRCHAPAPDLASHPL